MTLLKTAKKVSPLVASRICMRLRTKSKGNVADAETTAEADPHAKLINIGFSFPNSPVLLPK